MKNGVLKFIEKTFFRIKLISYSFNIFNQFYKGFKVLNYVNPCVVFFGSSEIHSDNYYYIKSRELARELASKTFTILTDAEGGIMEAANRGAKESYGFSMGCNIELEPKQKVNTYVDKYISVKYDFVKKEILRKYSCAFIFFPGGYGTLNHFFEILTLIKTKKTKKIPIILFGTQFYSNLLNHLKNMLENNIITQEEFQLFFLTDDVEEAINKIQESL